MDALWVLFIFMIFFLLISTRIKWWIRLFLGIYQIIVFNLYTKAYNTIEIKYEELTSTYNYNMYNEEHFANREAFLNARDVLLEKYQVYIYLPFIIFLIYSYYK